MGPRGFRPALAVLGVGVVLVGGAVLTSAHEVGRAKLPPRTETLEERTHGCDVCRKMTESAAPDEFTRDPHEFACSVCHHPHTQRSLEDWRATCSSDACHPRPWTRTVFHRVDAEVFVDCFRCHGVHVWSLDGTDCASCHGAVADSLGVLTVDAVAGVDRFDHGRHREVACAECHASERRHGQVSLASASDCSSCHHETSQDQPCSSCHGGREVAFAKNVQLPMQLSVWDGPRARNVAFAHGVHARGLECRACHEKGGAAGRADCAGCHGEHHGGKADCTQCHGAPPADAHDISVHQAECGDCHEKAPARSDEPERSYCLTCHRTMREHNPGERCVDCHDPAAIGED